MTNRSPKPWYIAAVVVTVVVLLLVGVMMRVELPTPDWWDVSGLPLLHAILNMIATILIFIGGVAIKIGKKSLHRKMMVSAVVVSGLFLVSYCVYHFTSGHTLFGDVNHDGVVDEKEAVLVQTSRPIYLIVLISHIVLAAVSFPLILFSIIAAAFQNFSLHKKFTRFAYPMWFYVAMTGPIVYVLIKPYYPS